MDDGIPLGKVAGFPLNIHWSTRPALALARDDHRRPRRIHHRYVMHRRLADGPPHGNR
jgi:hypothetical protein